MGRVLLEDWLSTGLGVLSVEVGEIGKVVEVVWGRKLVELGWLVEWVVGDEEAGSST